MNVTFRLVTDLGNFPWYVLGGGVAFLVLCLAWLYLGLRVVRAFEKWVTNYGQRKETPAVWPPSPPQGSTVQVGPVVQEVRKPANLSVPEVDPATILRRAPKPAGFSGSGDGGGQPEPAGGAPGGDDQKGPPPACEVRPGGRKL